METYKVKNNQTGEIKEIKEAKTTLFLYGNVFGRCIAKGLATKFSSNLVGFCLNSKLSKGVIKKFIRNNQINMTDYTEANYESFNDFFIRKINADKRPIDLSKKAFISPSDAKLIVYKINQKHLFKIKNSYYSVKDLINDDLAKEYDGGYALIFRLCVDDYHRYCYLDSGAKEVNHFIKGELHPVRPVVLNHYNIYKRNTREWTLLHTDNFGDIVQVEVGAMNVGKIVNHHQECHFKKGEEKGYFMFGGSTIVLLVKNNIVKINPAILKNSKENIETIVKYGETIGQKIS